MASSNYEFPVFIGKDERVESRIHETAELPSNAALRKILGFLGIILGTVGIFLISFSIAIATANLIQIFYGVILSLTGFVMLWSSSKLEKCPARGTIFVLTLTNKRLILSSRPDSSSASTKHGPELKTYQSRGILFVQILTIFLPFFIMVYGYLRGYTPIEFFTAAVTAIRLQSVLYDTLRVAGLFLLPLVVFSIAIFGHKSLKISLVSAIATAIVYYIYFLADWSRYVSLGFVSWFLAELQYLPTYFGYAIDASIILLSVLLLIGYPYGSLIIPYSTIIGIIISIGVQSARRGAGKTSESRGFGLPKGLLRSLPEGISHFWHRVEEEICVGGDYLEKDLARNAVRNIETRASPQEVPVSQLPILVFATFILATALGGGGYMNLNLTLMWVSCGATFISIFISKREFVVSYNSKIQNEANVWMNRGIIILIIAIAGSAYIPFAALTFPGLSILILLLTYQRVKGLILKEYFYAFKFVAQCGTDLNPPLINAKFSDKLRTVLKSLDAEGLIFATVTSSVFSEGARPTLKANQIIPLGTQNYEQRCLSYLNAFAERAASLVAATGVSFPFLVIGMFSLYSIFFSPITSLLLLAIVIVIIMNTILYSGFLLGMINKPDWLMLSKKKVLEGRAPSAIKYLEYVVLISGISAMLILMYGMIGYWVVALIIAQGVGYFLIKGTLNRIYLFGRGIGVYEGELWIERKGLTWTVRSPIYSYSTIKKGKEYVTIKHFEGYDVRGRYYGLKNAHSLVSLTSTIARLILKVIFVAFIAGMVLYAFFWFSSGFGWLTPWLLFIAIFMLGFVGSYSISNIVSSAVPSYGIFMDGKGSFDQFLSLDIVYPGIKSTYNQIQVSTAYGRSFPTIEDAQKSILDEYAIPEEPVPEIEKKGKQDRKYKSSRQVTEGSGMQSIPYYEYNCEVCGRGQAEYIEAFDQYLCEKCTVKMEKLYREARREEKQDRL